MGDERVERRRETRVPVEAGASVESGGHAAQAKSINMTSTGVLLRFDEPVSLSVGGQVKCGFTASPGANVLLPYWGLGRIVRVNDGDVAVELKGTGLAALSSQAHAALPASDPS
jgi:hypothetical protein